MRARDASAAARRLREAHFPDVKTLAQIDWDQMQGVSKRQIIELASCRFINRPEDVVIAGPIGTGKSHLAIALGVEAARRRFRVRFVKAHDLARQLPEARDDRELGTGAAAAAAAPVRPADHRRTREWLDHLPDSLRESALADKLEAICGLDLDERTAWNRRSDTDATDVAAPPLS